MSSDTEPRPAVKSADRVLDLFELFARWGREMSHTEVAEHLRIPKSSLSELLQTLVNRGYLELGEDKRGYRLGPSLLALARHQAGARNIVALARPVLEDLTRACGESCALNVLRGDEAVVAATVLGPHRLVSHMRDGDAAPLYATSGGKALLAFLPKGMRDEYLATVRFRKMQPGTISSVADLKRHIQQVRDEGVAYSHEEFTLGIVGIAVPVPSASGLADAPPMGAINVAMPSVRYNEAVKQTVVTALLRAVQQLQRSLA